MDPKSRMTLAILALAICFSATFALGGPAQNPRPARQGASGPGALDGAPKHRGRSSKDPTGSTSTNTPSAPLQIATSSLPSAEVGLQFQASLSATGGVQPYHWSVVSGTLPPTLSLNPNTGALSGTASQQGQFDFSVQLSDSSSPNPQTAMKALIISAVLALQITPGALPNGQVGMPFQASITATGGAPSYSWSVAGTLPSGLSLNASSGTVSGIPTQAGVSTFTLVVTDSVGQTAQESPSVMIATASSSDPVGITPSVPPAVNQGTTFQFTANAAGTWSCSGTDSSGAATACKGSINPLTGVYTAPATVMAQQSAGGMQLLPNNHVFNTRIDSLPIRSDSSTLIAGAGSVPLNYEPAVPINYANGSTPTESEVFYYSAANSGTFEIPAYPEVRIENGWFRARQYSPFSVDHHFAILDTTTGTMEEMYQYYPAGMATSIEGCPTCTSQSGQQYSVTAYPLPANGTSDAAGLDLWPLDLRLQELEQAVATGGTINHALRMTLQNGYLHNAFLWPATASANAGSGANYYGERVRLKSTFNISSYSAIAQILLKQLQQYGLIVADGGSGWAVDAEYTRWPLSYVQAFAQVMEADIPPSDFEVVDESSLEISSTSGEANANRETVTFTRTSDGATASVDIALQGVAVNLPQDVLYIQAGAPQQPFSAFVNIGTVTWAMSPSVGSLTSGGLYTPPATEASPTSTTITATSTTNSSVAAQMTVVILPNGVMRLAPGQAVYPGTGNYTDANGSVWYAGELTAGDAAAGFTTQSAFGDNNGGSWPAITDIRLYEVPIYSYNDLRFDFIVPNGTYQIDAKFANNYATPTDIGNFLIETQGTALGPPTDVYDLVGNNEPYDYTTTATVTTGKLSFVLREVNMTGLNNAPFISGLSVTPLSVSGGGNP
jgi:hypothetical protein